jgi:hypothetical protein
LNEKRCQVSAKIAIFCRIYNQKPVGHAEALLDTSTVSLFICLMIFGRPIQQYYG